MMRYSKRTRFQVAKTPIELNAVVINFTKNGNKITTLKKALR